MAIKRAEVFARRHGARIISITNEQPELIEHSTRGSACGERGRIFSRPFPLLLPLPEIDAICFPIVPAATLGACRLCVACDKQSDTFADARTYLGGIKKSSDVAAGGYLEGGFPVAPNLKLNGGLMESDNDWTSENLLDRLRAFLEIFKRG